MKQVVREYSINLNLPPEERWAEVASEEHKHVERVLAEMQAQAPRTLWFLQTFAGAYWRRAVPDTRELAPFRDYGVSGKQLSLAQASYELSQMGEALLPASLGIFGCTAGLVTHPEGVVHVRNMDWPLSTIGKATRVFTFFRKRRRFVTVGVPGFTGVLSGMLPGAYSVTINYAPHQRIPSPFGDTASQLLRRVLEHCDTYKDAVRCLTRYPLTAPVFYVVAGAEEGQGCIIERAAVTSRTKLRDVLTQANNYQHPDLLEYNDVWDEETIGDSMTRASLLSQRLADRATRPGSSITGIAKALDKYPIRNGDTHQKMVFRPRNGEYDVWAG